MRKLFFTAIALVAFSGVSMANTINDESTKDLLNDDQLKVLTSEKVETVALASCSAVWGQTRIYAVNQGFTIEQANCIAMAAYLNCVGSENATRDMGLAC